MIIYLAGGVTGNLNPLWKMVAHGKSFRDAYESFLSRRRDEALDTDASG